MCRVEFADFIRGRHTALFHWPHGYSCMLIMNNWSSYIKLTCGTEESVEDRSARHYAEMSVVSDDEEAAGA